MSFISASYLFFLAVAAAVYYLLPIRYRAFWIVCASWFFYLTWQPAFLLVLIFVTLISFAGGGKDCSRK